ncbi:hypothetical protein MVEN_02173200 [Mycena venus]|uniref:Ricin B lectin domain-containing protein n=1 Tax=Mycena venus TaxID=2733690 RepID=A0A8H7CH82_9AGAR|nr:hypothetical protein MVEN_02173200 [Mycena venus]
MLASTPTFFCLVASFLVALPSATAAHATAGEKMIFGVQTVVSNGSYLCLSERSDLSVNVIACTQPPETIAWAVTAGSAASTTPPLGTITYQYVPTATSPRNGTFCLAVNVTTSNIATVQDGTNVILKPCVSTDVTQQWAVREGDGTIRLGNGNKCLHPVFSTVGYTVQVTTCAAGSVDQKWTPIPKPPSRGIAGYEPGSTNMVIYRVGSSVDCFTAPLGSVVSGIVTLTACTFSSELPESTIQNLTFVAGSSFVGKGAPGAITVDVTGGPCLDLVTQTTNDTSVDYLGIRPCNGSLTQQWQVNNDSTISLANTNKCISGAAVPQTKLQVVDCVPGNVNQTWTTLQVSHTPLKF